jgi:signal transduction histidine kinase
MAAYLILASVIIRALVMFGGQRRLIVLALLVVYGILLIAYQQRGAWFAADRRRAVLYLGVQSLLVIGLILTPPHYDYFPLLFIPLSLSAVELLGRRYGFWWITGFVLVMLWQYVIAVRFFKQVNSVDLPTGLAMTILFGAMCFLVGQIVCIRRQAEQASAHNQRLLADLQVTHRQLQDRAVQLEELAVVQERSRLARELHDSVTQTVFSMTLAVQTAQVLLTKDANRVAAQLDRVVELARNASREIQAMVKQLRPASIAEQGLAAALRDFLAEREARDGLIAHLAVQGEAPLSENVTLGLYRIIQEAVNNVIKHAGTPEVTIHLNLCDRPASVEVIDRGAGFVVSELTPQRGHLGLTSMAERAREFGWSMAIESQPGQGTLVKVTAPEAAP